MVSHIGAKETPSAGSDPLGCASLFHLMSPAIFPGGQGPAPRVRCRRPWDIYRSISNLKRAAACGDDQQRVKASRALRSLRRCWPQRQEDAKLERERQGAGTEKGGKETPRQAGLPA